MKFDKIYLAIPYSGKEEESFKIANEMAGVLMRRGHVVFSPISHTHPIAKSCSLPCGWYFWERQDRAFIEWCDVMYVLYPKGWDVEFCKNSKGVNAEMKIAKKLNKPIMFITNQYEF